MLGRLWGVIGGSRGWLWEGFAVQWEIEWRVEGSFDLYVVFVTWDQVHEHEWDREGRSG